MTKHEFIQRNRHRYRTFIASPEWTAIRSQAVLDAGGKCKQCGETRRLEVHHNSYARFGGQEISSDLDVLCHWCHGQEHGKNKDVRKGISKKQRRRLHNMATAHRKKESLVRVEQALSARKNDEISRECYGFKNAYPPSITSISPAM